MFSFKIAIKYTVVLLFLLIVGCHDKTQNTIYKRTVDTKKDATCIWLGNKENFTKSSYMDVFYKYYNKKIYENKIELASKALELVCIKKAYYMSFDDAFYQTIQKFDKMYRNKLPISKTVYINTYYAEINSDKGNFKKAIYYTNKTTKIKVIDFESCLAKANAYYDLSFYNYSIGNQREAIKNNFKALDFFKKINEPSGIGTVYSNFSLIYSATENYDEAIKYLDQAIKYYQKSNDLNNVYIALHNKIGIYESTNDSRFYSLIDSTYTSFLKQDINDIDIKISIVTYYTKKLLDENKLEETKKILDEIKPEVLAQNSTLAKDELDIATAEYEIKKHGALVNTEIIKQAIPGLIEEENYQKLQIYYTILKQDAIKKKNFELALVYQEELKKISLEFGKKISRSKVIELDKKYQNQKKEQELQINKKTISNKNTTIALLITALLGFFFIVLAISLIQKQKKLTQEKLNAQLYTKQLLEKTEEERKRIASDLHDSVSHELLSLKNSFEEKKEITNQKIDAIINDIRIISRNLHPIMFDKVGLKESINQMVERAQSVNDFMVTSEIDYNGSLTSSSELQLYRIIQEALSNIIKYADAIAAKITITENNKNVSIEIKDNGKGFDVNENLNNGKSFGLHNIIERSKAIGAEAKIISDKNGTIINIIIPK